MLFRSVKTVVGTAYSSGIKIEGKTAAEMLAEIEDGAYDEKMKEEDG